jgi:hypothetical protein
MQPEMRRGRLTTNSSANCTLANLPPNRAALFLGLLGSAHEEHLIPKARWENTEVRGKSVALGALADNEKYKPATSLPGAHEKQDLVGAGHSET